MPFSSLHDFGKWHKRIQYRYNNAEDQALQRKQAALNRLHGPPRPDTSFAGRTKTGAISSPIRCEQTDSPRQQMAEREISSLPSNTPLLPRLSSPPFQCPPDCLSKKFCDPSNCALESVREANAIAEKLRRAE